MNGKGIPDITLERYGLNELPSEKMAALKGKAAADAGLRARIEALDESDAAILKAYPAAAMARAIDARAGSAPLRAARVSAQARVRPGRPWFLRPLFAAPAGLALACCLMLMLRPLPDSGNVPVTETAEAYAVRLKGAEAGLAIFRKTRGSAELLPPQALAKPGDTLQVFYHSRGAGYGVIFSVDGSGSLTLHLPESGNAAAALPAADLSPLPHAYRLDRAPRLERFFLITAPGPFAIDGLLNRARASFAVHHAVPDSLEGLEAGFRQYLYTLRKPARGGRTP